jgi:hypothetical protein
MPMLAIELPTFEAYWWPVMLEPVPGSGESIAVAHVVRAASGQSQVRQAIPPTTLNAMFGQLGKGVGIIVARTVLGLQKQLDEGVPVESLMAPFGGIAIGSARDCVAHDLNEVFEVASRLGGAFGASQFGVSEKPSAETQRAFDEWTERIRAQLISISDDQRLTGAFNVSVSFVERKRARIGFLLDAYAANFGVLRPGRKAASDSRALKVKIFDLEVLRRRYGFSLQRAELIVGCPDWSGNTVFTRSEADDLRSSWEFISHEALQRNITPVRCLGASEAATHLKTVAA